MDYNAADEKAVKAQEKKNKNLHDEELSDLRVIAKLPEGMRFFKRMMVEGHMFRTTFTGNSHGMFLEGHRNFALKLFGDLTEALENNPGKISELIVMAVEK